MPGLTEEIGLVGGQQIDHRLLLVGVAAAAQQSVVVTETVDSQFPEAALQAADQERLLAVCQVNAGDLVDQSLEESEFLVGDQCLVHCQ